MHTYKNYNRWDKFDIDAALKDCDQDVIPCQQPLALQESSLSADPMQDMKRARNRVVEGERTQRSIQASKQPVEKDADGWRIEGNAQFKKGNYMDAVECYTHSIEDVETVLAYANRAMANLKLGEHKEAEEDCSRALVLDNQFLKAYQRRAVAREALGNLEGAVEDLEVAVQLEPTSEAAKKTFLECLEKIAKSEKLPPVKTQIEVPVVVSKQQKSKNKTGSDRKNIAVIPVLQEMTTPSTDGIPGQNKAIIHVQAENNSGSSSQAAKISKPDDSKDVGKKRAGGVDPQATVYESFTTEEKSVSKGNSQVSSQQTSPRLPVKLPSKPPKSSAEFEAVWKSLKAASMNEKSAYISSIDAKSFPSIFKSSLSPPILVGVVDCALHELGKMNIAPEGLELWASTLEALVKVPRFKMVAMCISKKDRGEIGQAWDAACATRGDDDEYRNRLLQCRKAHGV